VIIQNRETQFDAPLYQLIHKNSFFPLKVIYTTAHTSYSDNDPELGFSPQWDHLDPASYSHRTIAGTNLISMLRLAFSLRELRPSLVLICGYYPYSHLLLALLLSLLGQRIGLRSDNLLVNANFNGIAGRFKRLILSFIHRLFDTWHPVGQQAHAYLQSVSGSDRPSYRFSYSVDNDWFYQQSNQARQQRSLFLQSVSWPSNAFVILGIMKWTPREDPLTLVRAFQHVICRCPHARLLLVGNGPLYNDVISLCSLNRAEVYTPGYSAYSRLPFWYGVANIFVHPSPREPWGVSVLEALASGLPVIAAEGVGAAVELIGSDDIASIFKNGDDRMLADLLLKQIQNPKRYSPSQAAYKAADQWHYRHSIVALTRAMQVH
jgi:glycosyltransferase involved in cell wall biosynthesis